MSISATSWTVAHRGSSVHGILQARILEWIAIPFSRGSSHPRAWTLLGLLKSGRFFTICAIREDQVCFTHSPNQLRNPCYSNLSSYTLYHIILGIYNKCCVYRKIWISIKRLNHVELLPEHWVCLLMVLPKDRKAKLQTVLLLTASEENTRDLSQSSVFSEQQNWGSLSYWYMYIHEGAWTAGRVQASVDWSQEGQ